MILELVFAYTIRTHKIIRQLFYDTIYLCVGL